MATSGGTGDAQIFTQDGPDTDRTRGRVMFRVLPRPLTLGAPVAVAYCVVAMLSFQLATGLSRQVTESVGFMGVSWLRTATAALVLLAITRPRLTGRSLQALGTALALGATLAVMSTALFAAAAFLPLGLVAAIAFLGPVSVAAFAASGRTALASVGLAATGVVLCLKPFDGVASGIDGTGVLLSLTGAAGWAAYILLSRKVGRCFDGLDGLTFALLAATVLLTPFGLSDLREGAPVADIALAAGLALLSPLLPCALEMTALRRLGPHDFGKLMSIEPAIALLLGVLFWSETLGLLQMAGVACIVLANARTIRS